MLVSIVIVREDSFYIDYSVGYDTDICKSENFALFMIERPRNDVQTKRIEVEP